MLATRSFSIYSASPHEGRGHLIGNVLGMWDICAYSGTNVLNPWGLSSSVLVSL